MQLNMKFLKIYLYKIKIDAFGDCLYCCFSFHLYKDQNSHGLIRDEIYDYIIKHKDNYINYFITDTNTFIFYTQYFIKN